MKLIQLSVITALATSAIMAGGDIAPVEPVVPTVVETPSNTTVSGKLTGYYITDDASATYDMFSSDYSQLGFAATLDVSHHFTENITANFSAVGYTNALKKPNYFYFENDHTGAFMNVANLTATFADTTFILGRQLLDTPMLGGFDWLLAPGAFEAYTVANSSFENITLVGSYVRTWRANNTGDEWIKLTDIGDGNNWTVGAVYDDKTISGNLWYYNVDALDYTEIYVDAGYNFTVAKVEAQYVNTNYGANSVKDSDAYGIKASGSISNIALMAAYENVSDNTAGYVGRDTLYTTSWNTFAATVLGSSFKAEASGEFSGISATMSYAYYEYDQYASMTDDNDGHEFDVILGYDMKESGINIINAIDMNLVYSNTNWGNNSDDINALELYANYKF